MFRVGYILSRPSDLLWFLALPFLAIGAALGCQQWLSTVVIASVAVWITAPHHFAGWVRAYGPSEDRRRFGLRLYLGPAAILAAAIAGMNLAPISILLFGTLWDHQHSIMQQHGFARIYDFKARTGLESTRHFDLALNWVAFVNLLITSPLFTQYWVRELYRLELPVSAGLVHAVQIASWAATTAFMLAYAGHVAWTLARGGSVNPLKYAFLGASYFLWYFAAWQTSSYLVYSVAHRIMHGMQYIVFVAFYMRRKAAARRAESGDFRLFSPGMVAGYVGLAFAYSVLVQALSTGALADFGFGLFDPATRYRLAIPEFSLPAMGLADGFVLRATVLTQLLQLTHYYFDSFIWKVREKSVQEGL